MQQPLNQYQCTPVPRKCRTSQRCFSCLTCRIHWRQREGFPITICHVRRTACTNTFHSHSSGMCYKLKWLWTRSILEWKIKSVCYWNLCWWLNNFVILPLESVLTLSLVSDIPLSAFWYNNPPELFIQT